VSITRNLSSPVFVQWTDDEGYMYGIFFNLLLKNFVRFAHANYPSMLYEPVGSHADGFRRSPFARSSHPTPAEFGFPVLVGLGPFIVHVLNIGRAALNVPSSSVFVSL
jgi:hypothetical protein